MNEGITVRLQGGLGNQLFQWAFGLGRSRVWDHPCFYDLGLLRGDPSRAYALGLFRLPVALAPQEREPLLARARFWPSQAPWRRWVKTVLGYNRGWPLYLTEEAIRSPDRLRGPARETAYEGYWQGEQWFAPVAAEVRSRLAEARDRLVADETGWRDAMAGDDTVAVHVRRGDYASNPGLTAYHGVLGVEHYRRAAEELVGRTGNARFFLFSDEPEWCGTELVPVLEEMGPCQVVRLTDRCRKEVWELMLMASCRHHIIANSSFSWWGAWLAEKPGQVVMAPKQWYAPGSGRTDSPCPERWVRV
jgi:hypothetical protein